MSLAPPGLLKQLRQDGSECAPISTRNGTAALAVLLVKMQREIPSMARKRKYRTWDVTARDSLLDDLYDKVSGGWRALGHGS